MRTAPAPDRHGIWGRIPSGERQTKTPALPSVESENRTEIPGLEVSVEWPVEGPVCTQQSLWSLGLGKGLNQQTPADGGCRLGAPHGAELRTASNISHIDLGMRLGAGVFHLKSLELWTEEAVSLRA